MFGHRAFRCFSKSFCKNTKDVILTQWTCDCKSHFYRNQRFISIVSKWGGNGLLSLIDFVKLGVATCLKFQKPKRIWVCWFKHLSSMKWAKTCRDRFSNAIIRKQPAQWTQTQHIFNTSYHHITSSSIFFAIYHLNHLTMHRVFLPKKGLQRFFGFFGFFGLGSSEAEELDFSSLPRVDEARCPDAQSNSLLQWKFKKKNNGYENIEFFFGKFLERHQNCTVYCTQCTSCQVVWRNSVCNASKRNLTVYCVGCAHCSFGDLLSDAPFFNLFALQFGWCFAFVCVGFFRCHAYPIKGKLPLLLRMEPWRNKSKGHTLTHIAESIEMLD